MLKRHLFLLLMLLGCSIGVSAQSEPPAKTVLTSIKPVALLVKALLPEQPVEVLVPVNRNLHDYALSVADLKKLKQAELLIWLGPQQEPFIARLQSRFSSHSQWFAVAEGQSHPWLSRTQLPGLIDALSSALQQALPQQQQLIIANAEVLKQAVEARFSHWQQQLKPHHHSEFLIGHSAFQPFTEGLGLEHALLYRGGHSHGHSHGGMHELLDIQKELASGNIRCALEEPDLNFGALKKRYPQLELQQVTPMANAQPLSKTGFFEFIDQTAQAIVRCLAADE